MITESMCVEKRLAIMAASNGAMRCLTQAHHQRQRIATWVAFLGRWQFPINGLIMKAIENALFSPLRGNIAIPDEVPYMTTRRIIRTDLTRSYRTLATRMDYLARLNHERAITEVLLRRFQDELSGAGRLCRNLERQLGLVLDRAPLPVGMPTAQGRS